MTSMLDPEVKPSPAREIVHQGKGCLAVLVAAAVLVVRRLLRLGPGQRLAGRVGRGRRLPGSGQGQVTVTVPTAPPSARSATSWSSSKVVQSDGGLERGGPRREERATSIQPGRYVMQTEMRAIDALTLLINPGESRVRVGVHGAGGSAAVRPGQRPGQGHQDQEVGVREGAGQAEDASACRRTRRTTPRASCSPTPTS